MRGALQLLSLCLATAGARVVIPKPLETQARAKPKSAVRVGGDRGNAVVRVGSLRGNALEAAGFLAGGALVFAGGRLPTPAMVPLVAWGIVARLSARSCEGIINATAHEEGRKASLRRQLPGLVAIAGVSAYYHMGALAGGRLSHRMISSALLGGYLLVECSLSHLRHEVGRTDTNPNHLTLTT
tara:strand:- start:111 stop:662 length:552 start_codon:yes stop_codon:yes gene_type:complete